MAFMDQINADIKSAMLAKEKDKLAVIRDIKSKLLLEATSGNGDVTEEAAMKIVLKLHKQRVETYELYLAQGRQDLADEEKYQADVIATYLPKMMSEEEIRSEVEQTAAQIGATGPQDMGKMMGVLSGKLAGKADGKLIASIVKETLNK